MITREFSPGLPDTQPTLIDTIRQLTIDENQRTLDAVERQASEMRATEEHARRSREALRGEIENGSISVQTEGMKVIIYVLEHVFFE